MKQPAMVCNIPPYGTKLVIVKLQRTPSELRGIGRRPMV
jgi:hypothetical protein